MNPLRLTSLLLAAISIILIQSCKLKHVYTIPNITNLQPNPAPAGSKVSIIGSNFYKDAKHLYKININGKSISTDITVPTEDTLCFIVPPLMGDGLISVSLTDGGGNSNGIPFYDELTVDNNETGIFYDKTFNKPNGLDYDINQQYLIVADESNQRVKTIRANKNIDSSDNHFKQLNDVAADKDGNIYVADYDSNRIQKIEIKSPHTIYTFANRIIHPSGVAVDDNNNVYVIGGDNITLYKNVSTPVLRSDLGALRVCFSKNRDSTRPILIADKLNQQILEVNEQGLDDIKIPVAIGTTKISPHDLAVDETGNIIALDQNGKRIVVIYKDNTCRQLDINSNLFGQQAGGIAIDTKNKVIYFSNSDLNNIIKVKYY